MIGTDIIQSSSRELEKIALSDSQLRKLEQKAQPGDILMTSGIPVMEDRRLSAEARGIDIDLDLDPKEQ